jgi:hypothetical protein
MHTGVLPISHRIVHYGCIHNLEDECDVLNNQLGDCMIEIDNIIGWRCPFYKCNVYDESE